MIYNLLKKFLFVSDPEAAHVFTIKTFSTFPKIMSSFFSSEEHNTLLNEKYHLTIGDLKWTFPIGLAAGLDKNAEAIEFFSLLPFGAIEVGTVTPLAQLGNPKPRMFRLINDESLRNQMGFNNLGANVIFKNISNAKRSGKLLGVNIGKNKLTSELQAPEDYRILYEKFSELSDYLVINVSSPNTPGLRSLQGVSGLRSILEQLCNLRKGQRTPLFVKLSPDLCPDDLPAIIDLLLEYDLQGLVATNTTIMKDIGDGGVSGKLLSHKACLIRKEILKLIAPHPSLDLIGVGGISSFDDLWNFWKQGGRVAQIYTSFIYQGPQILLDIKTEIDRVLKLNKMDSLEQLLNNIETAVR